MSKCPHCGEMLRHFTYAYACPHCLKLVKPMLPVGIRELSQRSSRHPLTRMPRRILRLLKSILLLPRFVASAIKQRRLQNLLNGREAERLDRIRNPSKYVGK